MMTLKQAFNIAVNKEENRYSDGTVNWNYVDADCAMDMDLASSYQSPESDNFKVIDCDAFYNEFDILAELYESNPFEPTA